MKRLCMSLALAVSACGGKTSSTPVTRPLVDDPSCPLLVPGTSMSAETTETGAALVFVTTGDPLAVRARAAKLAEMHTKHDGPANAMGMMFSPGSTATATESEGGARVEFTAATPEAIPGLQKEITMHATHMTGGSCEM